MKIEMIVNGDQRVCEADARQTLAAFLRDSLGLTGTHVGCNTAQCGACTVLVDGRPVKSCSVLALQCTFRRVTTIEGIGTRSEPHPMQIAFQTCMANQCGYCTPGMVMSCIHLVQDRGADRIGEQDIRHALEGNICRCTGYQAIVQAVREVIEARAGDSDARV